MKSVRIPLISLLTIALPFNGFSQSIHHVDNVDSSSTEETYEPSHAVTGAPGEEFPGIVGEGSSGPVIHHMDPHPIDYTGIVENSILKNNNSKEDPGKNSCTTLPSSPLYDSLGNSALSTAYLKQEQAKARIIVSFRPSPPSTD